MNKLIIILAVFVTITLASPTIQPFGIVEHSRCGGVGTFRELRISGCDGAVCIMVAGKQYPIEADLIPSSASPSLTLSVYAEYLGSQIPIVNTTLVNSSVQGGVLYTAKYALTPNDVLEGETLVITSSILHTNTLLLEACLRNTIRILRL